MLNELLGKQDSLLCLLKVVLEILRDIFSGKYNGWHELEWSIIFKLLNLF